MTTSAKTEPVRCKETSKLLARKDERGIWLYCKACSDQHFYLWSELLPTPTDAQHAQEAQTPQQ